MEVGATGRVPLPCAQTGEEHELALASRAQATACPDVVDLTAEGHGSDEEAPHAFLNDADTDRDAGPDEGAMGRLGLSTSTLSETNTVTLESSSDEDAPMLTLAERLAARNTS